MISYLISWLFNFVVLSLIIIFTLLYYYSTSTYDKWRKLGLPYAQPVPFFGNIFKMAIGMEHQSTSYERIYRQFPDAKICGFYQIKEPFLLIRDPELINTMIIKDFSYFTDHGIDMDESVNLLVSSLFFANGQKWKTMRQKLSPGFTSGKLKGTHNQINECSDQLLKSIEENSSETNDIEVREIVGNFATDVIGTCAYGLKLDTINNDNSDFRKHVKKILAPTGIHLISQLIGLLLPKVARLLKLKAFPLDSTSFFVSVFNSVIKYRSENNVVRNDVAQTLMEARKDLVINRDPTSKDIFTDKDIISNAIFLFAAGSETVTVTAAYCLYELALNKNIQDRLREEINSTKDKYDGQFNNNYLMDLHYADMVLDEIHRKYSIAATLMREATQTYKVPGESFVIEKGQKIIIPMYSIHHDPKYYPDPEVFDPERFTQEEKSKRPSGTFLPFGDGPRHCIGKRFAEMELKLLLSKVLSKFEILPCEKTEVPLVMRSTPGVVSPKNGIWLRFVSIVND